MRIRKEGKEKEGRKEKRKEGKRQVEEEKYHKIVSMNHMKICLYISRKFKNIYSEKHG